MYAAIPRNLCGGSAHYARWCCTVWGGIFIYVPARIYSFHIGEDEYLKHRARIDLSPMTKVRTVQISIVQFLAYFDQFPHRFILRDLYSDFKRKYYLTSVSHCVIIYLLSGVFLAIILYHKSSVQATPFWVTWTFFWRVIATAPFF